ncbi:MAG TPA: hypothetical protein VIK72_09295 [Clostridiaceae bacterium]
MSEAEKMVKETWKISKKLNETNAKIFIDIVCYLRVSSIEEKEKEDIISEILDMFLRYQEENKPIEEAIGKDYKGFCDSIIESVKPKKLTLNKAWEYFKMIIISVLVLLTINFIMNYIPKAIKSKAIINYELNLGFLVGIIIIMALSIGIVDYIGKNSFKSSKTKHSKKVTFLVGAGFGLSFALLVLLTYKLSSFVLFSINGYVVFIVICFYWLFKLIKKVKLKLKK